MAAPGPSRDGRRHGGRVPSALAAGSVSERRPWLLILVVVAVSLVIGSLAALARDYQVNSDANSAVDHQLFAAATYSKRSMPSRRGPGTNMFDRCDQNLLITYLRSHSREAAIWSNAFESDSQFIWHGKRKLDAHDVEPYIRDLSTRVLGDQLSVTEHMFTSRPIAVESVLPSGTAVLTDNAGIARVRCKSGDPLTTVRVVVKQAMPAFVKASYSRLRPRIVIVNSSQSKIVIKQKVKIVPPPTISLPPVVLINIIQPVILPKNPSVPIISININIKPPIVPNADFHAAIPTFDA